MIFFAIIDYIGLWIINGHIIRITIFNWPDEFQINFLVFLLLMIINYVFELIYAKELGVINWKSTAILGFLIYWILVYYYLIRINWILILVPVFTPVFLIAFYFYYKIQSPYLEKWKGYGKVYTHRYVMILIIITLMIFVGIILK
jgi:hypothetical protein